MPDHESRHNAIRENRERYLFLQRPLSAVAARILYTIWKEANCEEVNRAPLIPRKPIFRSGRFSPPPTQRHCHKTDCPSVSASVAFRSSLPFPHFQETPRPAKMGLFDKIQASKFTTPPPHNRMSFPSISLTQCSPSPQNSTSTVSNKSTHAGRTEPRSQRVRYTRTGNTSIPTPATRGVPPCRPTAQETRMIQQPPTAIATTRRGPRCGFLRRREDEDGNAALRLDFLSIDDTVPGTAPGRCSILSSWARTFFPHARWDLGLKQTRFHASAAALSIFVLRPFRTGNVVFERPSLLVWKVPLTFIRVAGWFLGSGED